MKIIIPRLPKQTGKRELRELVASVLDKRFHVPFTEHPHVAACDIMKIRDSQGIVEHHGLVTIVPHQAGSWLLSHFKGQHLHGKLVLARQFLPRTVKGQVFDPSDDRRRPDLEISRVDHSVAVQGIKEFAQIHSA